MKPMKVPVICTYCQFTVIVTLLLLGYSHVDVIVCIPEFPDNSNMEAVYNLLYPFYMVVNGQS